MITKKDLELSSLLPLKPNPVVLEGKLVKLVPMDLDRDIETLFKYSNGESVEFKSTVSEPYDPNESIWQYLPSGPFLSASDMREYYEKQLNLANFRVFTLFEKESNLQVGSFSYSNNAPNDLRVEIGGVWISPVIHRGGLCSEATYLMIQHAFDVGYRRVEWKTCTSNVKSRNFALKIGFSFETYSPEWCIFKGICMDADYYGLFRDDWNNGLGVKARRFIYKEFS